MEDERFKRLFRLEDNLYVDAAPVIIEKGSLLLDKQTNTLLIQLKFHSLSVKKIKALTIRISTYYASGEKHPETVEYQYLDLLVEYGTRFGEKKAILLKDDVIRSFSIDSYSVVYEDKTVAEVKGTFKPLPVAKELQEEWINLELQKQYRMETTEEAKYIPIHYQNLWRCTCGEWNLQDTCNACQNEKEKIFGKLNVQNLTEAMNERLKKEAAEREEQKRREEEEAKRQEAIRQEEEIRRKKQIKTIRRIAAPVILVGIFAFGIYSFITRPIKPKVAESKIYGLEKPLAFYPDSFYEFEVIGAGTENKDPHNGDERWTPIYWSMYADPSGHKKYTTWKLNAENGIYGDAEKTYSIYIFFQKEVYENSAWNKQNNSIESLKCDFKAAPLDKNE